MLNGVTTAYENVCFCPRQFQFFNCNLNYQLYNLSTTVRFVKNRIRTLNDKLKTDVLDFLIRLFVLRYIIWTEESPSTKKHTSHINSDISVDH